MAEQLDFSVLPKKMRNRDYGGLYAGTEAGRGGFQTPVAPTQDSRRGSFGPGEGGTWAPGTGFRNTGRIRERYEDLAAGGAPAPTLARSAELGEPTSFRAGAGAPAPVNVMSGSQRGFVNPAGGPAYATPQMAGQAYNREEGVGTWRPSGQTLAETEIAARGEAQKGVMAAENRDPQKVAQAAQIKRAEIDAQNKQIEAGLGAHVNKHFGGTYDKTGKMVPPTDQSILRARDNAIDYAKEKGGIEHGKNYMTWDQQLRSLHPQVFLKAMQQNPADWDTFVRGMGPTLPKVSMAPGQPTQPAGSSFLGPAQLQGEVGVPQPGFVAPTPTPTQPTGALRDLTESMGY